MIRRLIFQRKDGDCGVAALATYLGLAYEDVYLVVARVDREYRGGRGLTLTDLEHAAKKLGRPLRRVRCPKPDDDDDEGVLVVNWKMKQRYRGHYVTLLRGLVIDPADGVILPWDEYLQMTGARLGTLLVECGHGMAPPGS